MVLHRQRQIKGKTEWCDEHVVHFSTYLAQIRIDAGGNPGG